MVKPPGLDSSGMYVSSHWPGRTGKHQGLRVRRVEAWNGWRRYRYGSGLGLEAKEADMLVDLVDASERYVV